MVVKCRYSGLIVCNLQRTHETGRVSNRARRLHASFPSQPLTSTSAALDQSASCTCSAGRIVHVVSNTAACLCPHTHANAQFQRNGALLELVHLQEAEASCRELLFLGFPMLELEEYGSVGCVSTRGFRCVKPGRQGAHQHRAVTATHLPSSSLVPCGCVLGSQSAHASPSSDLR